MLFLYIIIYTSTRKTFDYDVVSKSNDLFNYVDDTRNNKETYNIINNENKENTNNNNNIESSNNEIKNSKYGIYTDLFHLLSINKPNIEPLTRYKKDNKELEKFVSDNTKFTKSFLENLLPLSDDEKKELTKSFNNFKLGIKDLNLKYFGRNDNDGIHKIEGTGILMVGGYKFSWLSLLNIHQLRRRGSKLPIEVYIPDKREYDENFCNVLLPQLNAVCILGYEELPFEDFKNYFNLKRYEYKMMAILTSKFENILLLDADNVVIENPDNLFNWKNYIENQLILWPDTWQRTSNPFLFDLVNVTVDYSQVEDINNYNLHDLPGAIQNPSTESGMILVNKKSQLNTLLISLYFNIYGFDYYYPLMTQGGAGQGDKDSYIFAAHAANLPVYQVKQGVSFLGRFSKQGDFISSALGQCNPTTEEEEIAFKNNIKNPGCKELMFVHLSFPKLYPNTIGEKVQNKDEGNIIAFDGVDLSYDFELQIWELMCQLVCSNYKENSIQPDNPASTVLDSKFLASAKKMEYIQSIDIDNVCDKELLPHLEFMRGYFKYADKHKNQFTQDWEGKNLLNAHLQNSEK